MAPKAVTVPAWPAVCTCLPPDTELLGGRPGLRGLRGGKLTGRTFRLSCWPAGDLGQVSEALEARAEAVA